MKLHLSPLKHLYRCMEKMCLKGGKQRYMCFNICDIVRCIVECDDCENVTAVLQALQACRQIRMLRVKDRSNHLTSMNWMDIMVNVVLVADEHVHVCEIQIVHAKMLLARAGLGGHGPYGKARAATEILDVRMTGTQASSRLHSSSGKGAAAADQTTRDAFKVVHTGSVFAPFDSPAARAADDGFAAQNPMHVGAQGLVPPNQDGAMESLKERTLRIYNETPDTMRQTNLSLGTEDGEIEEEESAVV